MALNSEEQFLALIDAHFPARHPRLALGRGDDCAVLRCPSRLCVSTDLFLENVHFRRSYFSPEDIGYKALAVNVSDIAAMGAVPAGFTLELMVPRGLDERFFERLFSGMAGLARVLDIPLLGGDLSRAEALGLGIAIFGEAGPSGRFLTRCAASGDLLFVCGRLGLARAGLLALEEFGPAAADRYPEAVAAHLRPRLLVREGTLVAACPKVRGLMDLSDGLARDLPRLLGRHLGSTLGAELSIEPGTLCPEVLAYAGAKGLDAADFAVLGGEDYALLGAVPPQARRDLAARVPGLCFIGRVTDGPDILVNGRPLAQAGFDHFTE